MTGDENLIEATLIVQYKVTDLGRLLFGAERPADLLASAPGQAPSIDVNLTLGAKKAASRPFVAPPSRSP